MENVSLSALFRLLSSQVVVIVAGLLLLDPHGNKSMIKRSIHFFGILIENKLQCQLVKIRTLIPYNRTSQIKKIKFDRIEKKLMLTQ